MSTSLPFPLKLLFCSLKRYGAGVRSVCVCTRVLYITANPLLKMNEGPVPWSSTGAAVFRTPSEGVGVPDSKPVPTGTLD